MTHGLFGKLNPGEMQGFTSWQEVAKYARELSKNKTNIYKSIISFKRETANELGLQTQKDWQKYIETHILTIAKENNIKVQNLGFVCAVHNERHHPHIHIDFWDKDQQILCNFTPKEIPNKIRKQLIKDTFEDRIKEFYEQKEKGLTEIKEVTDQMVGEFENYIRELYPKEYKQYKKLFETYDEDSIIMDPINAKFNIKTINKVADKIFKLKDLMPKTGRLAYKLLPSEAKEELDSLVNELLKRNTAFTQAVNIYVDSKINLVKLYSSDKNYLNTQKKKFQKEAEKLIVNRILGAIKVILKKEKDIAKTGYTNDQKSYYAEQLLLGILDLFGRQVISNERKYDDLEYKANSTELSKQARVEYYLKNKDKGIEL
jgi:uncharacterized Zn-finger protein